MFFLIIKSAIIMIYFCSQFDQKYPIYFTIKILKNSINKAFSIIECMFTHGRVATIPMVECRPYPWSCGDHKLDLNELELFELYSIYQSILRD